MYGKMYGKRAVIVVYDAEKNLCLACARSDRKNAWQFPQGNFEPYELPLQAASRELFEETGLIVESNFSKMLYNRCKIVVDINCVADIEYAKATYVNETHDERNLSIENASVKFVKSAGPYFVEYPDEIKRTENGQEQFWFLAEKTRKYLDIKLNYEFSHYAWMRSVDVIESIVQFKKDAYFQALKEFMLV